MQSIDELIRSRWANAEAFYQERDHRTRLEVNDLHAYAERPIEIHVDGEMAEDPTIQQIAILASNLTARWATKIKVVVPNVALAPPLATRSERTLSARIRREMCQADPFGTFHVGEHELDSEPDTLRLRVGARQSPKTVGDDYVIDASGWSVLGQRAGRWSNYSRTPATAPAAALAAAIGACDLFKRAIRHPVEQWIRDINWCTWDSTLSQNVTILKPTPLAPQSVDLGNLLVAGVGAVGSALLYILGLMPVSGRVTALDLDCVDVSNLNRSPLFTVEDAALGSRKTEVAQHFLSSLGVKCQVVNGTWSQHAEALSQSGFDTWISLTNEHGAWAEVPFQLPPVVLHGTTTSGWGVACGRHIPRIEDCTACRLPRPHAEFRGPCAEGDISTDEQQPVRASLPFLSSISAALVASEILKLDLPGATARPNSVSADFRYGLPSVVAVSYRPNITCHGCRISELPLWSERGGRGRYAGLSAA
jgi:hypothetical protein